MELRQTLRESPAVAVIFSSTRRGDGSLTYQPCTPDSTDGLGYFGVGGQLVAVCVHAPGNIFTIPIGLAADRIGRKPILIPSLVVFGFSGSSIIFISDFTLILALRAIQGQQVARSSCSR